MRWIDKQLGYYEDFYDEYDDEYIFDRYEKYMYKNKNTYKYKNFDLLQGCLSYKERVEILDELGISNSDLELGEGLEIISDYISSSIIEDIAYDNDILWDKTCIDDENSQYLRNGLKVSKLIRYVENVRHTETIVTCPYCEESRFYYETLRSGKYFCKSCKTIVPGFKGSKGELTIEELLRLYGFEYEREVNEFEKYRFDFKIIHNGKIYYMEIHGLQHYTSIDYFGGEDAFKKTVLNDKIKERYAREHGVYIVLDFREHNVEILKQRFENEFINKYIKGECI